MKKLIAILSFALLAACSSSDPLSTKFDMTTASKAAYTARSSYFIYLTVADRVKKNVPLCSAATQANICITTEQMDVLKRTELSTDQATLAGVTAVRSLGERPTAIAAAIAAADAAVASFKAQTDVWKDKVKS